MEFKKKQIEARACIELYSNGERCVVKPLKSFGKIPITMALIDVTPPRGGLKALIKEKEFGQRSCWKEAIRNSYYQQPSKNHKEEELITQYKVLLTET